MKTKFETLKSVVAYVKNESDNPIDELLMMGFTPCQLVYEFGFDADEVKTSDLYEDVKDIENEDLDGEVYPFVLSNYSPFDAALVSRFKLSSEQLLCLKEQGVYQNMKTAYEEKKIEAETELFNEVFDEYEDELLEEVEEIEI